MDITFYYAPFSSAVPVASALAELEVPHKQVTFDLAKLDQRAPEFLALNPNGKVPTLVVDGTPMFEALAIMQWLGARFGVAKGLWPALDTPAYLTANAWTTWAYVTYGRTIHQLHLATAPNAPEALRNAEWANYARDTAQELLAILDGHLARKGFIVGDAYSLADVIVSGVVLYGRLLGASIADHAHVSKWVGTCESRPAIAKEWGG